MMKGKEYYKMDMAIIRTAKVVLIGVSTIIVVSTAVTGIPEIIKLGTPSKVTATNTKVISQQITNNKPAVKENINKSEPIIKPIQHKQVEKEAPAILPAEKATPIATNKPKVVEQTDSITSTQTYQPTQQNYNDESNNNVVVNNNNNQNNQVAQKPSTVIEENTSNKTVPNKTVTKVITTDENSTTISSNNKTEPDNSTTNTTSNNSQQSIGQIQIGSVS